MNSRLQWRLLWLVNSRFMLTISCVVLDDAGRVLLQRHRHWVEDVWGLPGGIVKSGETLEQAVAREVKEETDLRVTGIELVRVVSGYRLRVESYLRACLASGPQRVKLQESEVLEARFFCPAGSARQYDPIAARGGGAGALAVVSRTLLRHAQRPQRAG